MTSLADIFSLPTPKRPKRIVAESLNPARDLINDLVFWLETMKDEIDRAPGLHASSLWKTCPREPLLSAIHADKMVPEKLKAGNLMTFNEGHALHELMQNTYLGPWGRLWGDWKCIPCQEVIHTGVMPKACPQCGNLWRDPKDGILNIVYAESFVKCKELGYCGHCDGIVLDRTLTKKRVFEFKTISKSQYGGLRRAKNAHVVQVHAYMHALNLKEALVLYWDKGSQCDWRRTSAGEWLAGPVHLKSYLIKFDENVWQPMVRRINDYHKATKMVKELPVVTNKEVMSFKRVCSHAKCDLAGDCPVRKYCFGLPK